MNFIQSCSIVIALLILTGCTTTPDKYKKRSSLSGPSPATTVNNDKARAVAQAGIGVPQMYVDRLSGRSVLLTVKSEYFSANGRVCRRYSEVIDGNDVPGISCQDKKRGWIEVPLSSFIR